MSLAHPRSLVRTVSALAISLLALAACAPAAPDDDGDALIGAPDEGVSNDEDALSGAQAVGSTLIATTDVNLRKSPSTSAAILHVIPTGAEVTVVTAEPQSGFYQVNHKGTIGWSYAIYYKAAPAPPPPPVDGPVTAADLLAVAQNCKQLAGTTKFRSDSGTSQTIPVCGLSGAVWWKSDLDVDCDGGQSSACKNDPDYQSGTAASDSKGKALNASTLPYVVIPQSSNGFNYKTAGLKMGSVVAVIYGGKVAYGILGDVGPAGVIGEASYAMAQQLGLNPSPTSGGAESGVTYVAFTGASAVVSKNEDHAQAVTLGQAAANKVIQSN
jgi:glycosyl hydrolase group 75 (putative chitosanase)/SH3 domain-containing protein